MGVLGIRGLGCGILCVGFWGLSQGFDARALCDRLENSVRQSLCVEKQD